jgi:hypothetical protein
LFLLCNVAVNAFLSTTGRYCLYIIGHLTYKCADKTRFQRYKKLKNQYRFRNFYVGSHLSEVLLVPNFSPLTLCLS